MLHQLNQLELQNIRHLIGAHCTIEKKLNEYASKCQLNPNYNKCLQKMLKMQKLAKKN